MPDRRQAYRRWEDEPWTRGEQQSFEHELGAKLDASASEIARLRRVAERGIGVVVLLGFVTPIIVAIIIALLGRG